MNQEEFEKQERILKRVATITKHTILLGGGIYALSKISFAPILETPVAASIFAAINVYYVASITRRVFLRRQKKQAEKEEIKKLKEEICTLLNKDIKTMAIEELEQLKDDLWNRAGQGYYAESIQNKSWKVDEAIEQYKNEKENRLLGEQKESLEQEIQDLKRKKLDEEKTKYTKQAELRWELLARENTVFLKGEVDEEQTRILEKEGFKQSNQYCVNQQCNVTVLVRPVMNRSATHVFLSWSVKELLESYNVANIQEHATRDADITFTYNKRTYTIEIETGNLLKKKKQLAEKVEYLNRRYKDRWFFIVSHRNLLNKYKQYGPTITRKQVVQQIEKMLSI